MNSFKAFLKAKGLYLVCLALVFAATITGILAIRSVVNNVADLTKARQKAVEEGNTWNVPDTIANNPVTDVPVAEDTPTASSKPSAAPSSPPSSSGAASRSAAASGDSAGSAASSALQGTSPGSSAAAEPIVPFSGQELVYNETLGDWRTHNGADYACAAGASVAAVRSGKVTAVYEDALWGGIVEVSGINSLVWRYCGIAAPAVVVGDAVVEGDVLGAAGAVPSETKTSAHFHLECTQSGEYLDPEKNR